jgi:ParB family chromosome partitioning protein
VSRARGLGRGLTSLIPDDALSLDGPGDAHRVRLVPIAEVVPNPDQPRDRFDDHALGALAESIRSVGLLAPLVVRRHEGRYVLLAGERRLRAAALAGLAEVPVLVREIDDPRMSLELALVENLLREDLDAIETARGFSRLVEEFGLTQEQVAQRVGRDRATVANALRLLKLPDFAQTALREGRLTAGHARALLALEGPEEVAKAMARIEVSGLNVRQTERMVGDLMRGRRPAVSRAVSRALLGVARTLQDSLRASVAIAPRRNGGGMIVIRYADATELDRLVQRLRQ